MDLDFGIPDPGVKKAPDPASTTLTIIIFSDFGPSFYEKNITGFRNC
jgi:hypothetical protein